MPHHRTNQLANTQVVERAANDSTTGAQHAELLQAHEEAQAERARAVSAPPRATFFGQTTMVGRCWVAADHLACTPACNACATALGLLRTW